MTPDPAVGADVLLRCDELVVRRGEREVVHGVTRRAPRR